ncbi:MAG: DUF2721 domain-containing protein [Chthoniobacterales bacterium]
MTVPAASAMGSLTDNPFAALTFVVAPAILTNAASVLCLGTANRLARVLDRTRAVSAQLAHLGANEDHRLTYQHQLAGLEVRWNLVLRGLRLFYMSLGAFAAAALFSLIGSIVAISVQHAGFALFAVLGLTSGMLGVAGLIIGCAILMRETRLAVQSLAEETQLTVHPSDNP